MGPSWQVWVAFVLTLAGIAAWCGLMCLIAELAVRAERREIEDRVADAVEVERSTVALRDALLEGVHRG